jgi:extracellular factor (EF) 3-hydroxypalmitic acid methyl ester biosynthesis protein
MGEEAHEIQEAHVAFQTSQGLDVRGGVFRLRHHSVVFEIYEPAAVLQTSESIETLRILDGDRTLYEGRAVISGVVRTGPRVVCEAKLEASGAPVNFDLSTDFKPAVENTFDRVVRHWQSSYRIAPEFKVVVVDVAAFLGEVGYWLEDLETAIKGRTGGAPSHAQEIELVETLAPRIIEAFNNQHERFEELASSVRPEFRRIHENFVRRHWQNLFLCSPFGHRTYYKPLGYAGDYEMMNMIHRNRPEGNSVFAKLIHFLLVSQWPAKSVRNRIAYLKEQILRETTRVLCLKRPCKILNVGCGPAQEIQYFLRDSAPSRDTQITLLDFDDETLHHARAKLVNLNRQYGHRVRVETQRVSVYQLLRRGAFRDKNALDGKYDLIYCTGLFDYLPNETCRSLVQLFHSSLEPDGLVVVANMKDEKPFRYFIEFVLDWHLIYRDTNVLSTFAPKCALDTSRVEAEDTSVNLFLHVRRRT